MKEWEAERIGSGGVESALNELAREGYEIFSR